MAISRKLKADAADEEVGVGSLRRSQQEHDDQPVNKFAIALESHGHVEPAKPRPEDWDVPGTHYNCFNCTAMCCSVYERVALNAEDIERLAQHFGMGRRLFLKTYTHRNGREICLNRVEDELLGQTCVLLNQETRLCGVHPARPHVCRVWPPPETQGRCVYYDVLQFERFFQQDRNVVIKIEVEVTGDADEDDEEIEYDRG